MTLQNIMNLTGQQSLQAGALNGAHASKLLGSQGALGGNTDQAHPFLAFLQGLEGGGDVLPGEVGSLQNLSVDEQAALEEFANNALSQFPGIVTIDGTGELNVDLEGLAGILGVEVSDLNPELIAETLGTLGASPASVHATDGQIASIAGGLSGEDGLPSESAGLQTEQAGAGVDLHAASQNTPMGLSSENAETTGAVIGFEGTAGTEELLPADMAEGGLGEAPMSVDHPAGQLEMDGTLTSPANGLGDDLQTSMSADQTAQILSPLGANQMASGQEAAATSDAHSNPNPDAATSPITQQTNPIGSLQSSNQSLGQSSVPSSAAAGAQAQSAPQIVSPVRPGPVNLTGELAAEPSLASDEGLRSGDALDLVPNLSALNRKSATGGLVNTLTSSSALSSNANASIGLPNVITALQNGILTPQVQQSAPLPMMDAAFTDPSLDASLNVEQIVNGDIAPESEFTTTAQSKMDVRPSSMDRVMTAEMPSRTIAVSMVRAADRGRAHFEIRLDPPELGRVDVRMSVAAAGTVKAHLSFEKAETLELFQRDARALERALADAGLEIDAGGLEFSLSDDGEGAFQQALSDDPAFSDQNTKEAASDLDDVSDELIDITSRFNGHDGRINLLI